MVRAGQSVTLSVQGRTGGFFRPEAGAMRSDVIGFISAYFTVESVEINIRSALGSIAAGELWNYDYSALVTVKPRSDYGSPDDIASIVAHAFYITGGALPTVQVSSVSGSLGGVTSSGPDLGGALQSFADLPKILIVGIVALVAIIAFSPAGTKLAGRKIAV